MTITSTRQNTSPSLIDSIDDENDNLRSIERDDRRASSHPTNKVVSSKHVFTRNQRLLLPRDKSRPKNPVLADIRLEYTKGVLV